MESANKIITPIGLRVLIGDCVDSMRGLEPQSIDCCVTSPPYFGLRDYGHSGQIGAEDTPEQFVAALVSVFRQVRRVLRDDGTLWLNLGDSYATGTRAERQPGNSSFGKSTAKAQGVARIGTPAGMKTKDLLGIPWMVAFALRADGWYLRQDIIWHKPNSMPESVRDRCTKAHEYIFLLTKSDRYYYDHEAIKEQSSGLEMRNRRSVWSVNTKPYRGAHFAAFPPELVKPCILAGCREGGTVLDPFGGSGTTAGVALSQNRASLLCEINPEYAALVGARVSEIAGVSESKSQISLLEQ